MAAKKKSAVAGAVDEATLMAAKDELWEINQERTRLMDAAKDMRAGHKDLLEDADPDHLDEVDETDATETYKIDVRLGASSRRLRAVNARMRELSRMSTKGQTTLPGT